MQVVTNLRRWATGSVAMAIVASAQLLQPAGVKAQTLDFAQEAQRAEAQRALNEVRARLPNCNILQPNGAMPVLANATEAGVVNAGVSRGGLSNSNARARPTLTWNATLARIAQQHSSAMAQGSFFDHVDLNGKTVANRAKEAGYRYRVVAENIAAGQDNLPEVIMEWIASKGHCENMIDERVTEFGIAVAASRNPADPFTTYWTLVLGTQQR